LDIDPAHLNRWGDDWPRPGIYNTRWEVRVEYRDTDKPNSQRLKMPPPGALSVLISAPPPPSLTRPDGTPTILYGKAIGGIALGTTLPQFVLNPAMLQKSPRFVDLGSNFNGHFMVTPGQRFQVRLYLQNTTNQPITLSTYMRHPDEPTESGEIAKGGVREITLRPLEEKYLYSPQLEYTGEGREFNLNKNNFFFSMIISKDGNERTLSLIQQVRFGKDEKETSLSTGRLDLALAPATDATTPIPYRAPKPRANVTAERMNE